MASAKAKPKKKKKKSAEDEIARLVKKARALGPIVMPFDEIRLGAALAKQPRRSVLGALLALADDPNMHARRVALGALHRLAAWDDPRVMDLLVAKLGDPEGWVRYDAAWALGDSATTDARAIAGLKKLARGAKKDPPLSDGDERAKAEAAEALEKLGAAR